jgi:hypothetical protein
MGEARERLSPAPTRVRDQSYDVGSRPYRACQATIAFITRARDQRGSMAPGWQALQ